MSRSAGPASIAARQGRLHLGIGHGAEVDVGRDVRGRREDPAVGDLRRRSGRSRRGRRRACGSSRSVGGRPPTDGRGALGRPAPAALQLVQGRVELAPLAAGEEAPFQGVLEPVVVLARLATGDLGAGAADVQAVEDARAPGAVVGPLADQAVEPPPVVGVIGSCQP